MWNIPGIGPEAKSNPATLRIKCGIIPKSGIYPNPAAESKVVGGKSFECSQRSSSKGNTLEARSGYYRSGSNGQKVCSPRLLRPWKPKTCSLCSKDRLHTCPLSGERSAPTLRPRKLNYEALQLRASTRPHAA